MAMGLNHYLKYYCLTTVSWYADIAVEIPEELPMVDEEGRFGSESGYSLFPGITARMVTRCLGGNGKNGNVLLTGWPLMV